jgi:tetratricopeptide (TPR) repeat protein
MKISSGWKNAAVVATVLCLSACTSNGYQSSTKVPDDKTIATDQAEWQRLTTAADAAAKSGDKATAESNYKAAIASAENLSPDTSAQSESLANLANFYYVQGDGAQADGVYKKALALHEKALGLEHVDLVKDLLALARVCHSEKKEADAATYYERATAIAAKANKPLPQASLADYYKSLDSQKSK